MKNKNKIFGTLCLVFGLCLFTVTSVHALYYNPQKETSVQSDVSFAISTSSTPIKLLIPKIEVDAKVEQVGITFKGNMSTPKKLNDVGWYKYGTVPGNIGSSVIDGHVDNGFALPGIFKNLKKLEIGDDVYVFTETGTELHFKVIDVKSYYYTEVPRTLLFNKTGGIYLNLITCDGNWINEAETSDHRIVVYTELVR